MSLSAKTKQDVHPLTVVRKKLNKTQAEMAEFLECSLPTIRAIEQGKLKLSVKLAWKINQRTGVGLDALLKTDADKVEAMTESEMDLKAAEFSMMKRRTPPSLQSRWEAVNLCIQVLSMLHGAALDRKEALFAYRMHEALKPILKEFPLSKHIPLPNVPTDPKALLDLQITLESTVELFWKELAAYAQEPIRPPLNKQESHE